MFPYRKGALLSALAQQRADFKGPQPQADRAEQAAGDGERRVVEHVGGGITSRGSLALAGSFQSLPLEVIPPPGGGNVAQRQRGAVCGSKRGTACGG